MQNRPSLIVAAGMAFAALTAAVGLGYWETRASPTPSIVVSAEDAARSRQQIERRRGRMAEVAIAGSTTQ